MAGAPEDAIETALYTKLTGASGLTSLLAGTASVYAYLAPENDNPPYVVYSNQSNVPAYTLSGTAFENALYLVKGVTAGPGMGQAGSVAKQIDLALNDQALTITGYTHMLCRRESTVRYTEVDPGGQRWNHAGFLFRIQADPS